MNELFTLFGTIKLDSSGVGGQMGEIEGEVEKSGGKISSMFNSVFQGIGQFIGMQAMNAVSQIGQFVSGVDNAAGSIKSFQANMQLAGQSSNQIKQVQDSMEQYAQATVYNTQDMLQTVGLLTTSGVKNAGDLTKAMGNISSAASDPQEALKSLSLQLTQVNGKGFIQTMDFRIMQEQASGPMKMVQEDLEKLNHWSPAQFQSALSSGAITSDMFNKALMDVGGSSTKTGAMLEKNASTPKTFGQAFATVIESLQNSLIPVMENVQSSLIPMIENLIPALVSGISSVITTISGISKVVMNVIDWFQKGGTAADVLKGALVAIGVALAGFGIYEAVIKGIAIAQGIWNSVVAAGTAIQEAFTAVMTLSTGGIVIIITAVAALVAGLVYFFTQTKTGQQIWAAFVKDITAIWNGFVAWIKPILTDIGKFFSDVWKGIQDAVKAVFDFISNNIIKPAVLVWKDIIEPAMEAIGKVFSDAWEVIKTIFIDTITVIAVILGTIYHAIVDPIVATFDFLKPYIQDGLKIISDVFNTVIGFIYNNIIKPIFDSISTVIQTAIGVWNNVINPALNAIQTLFKTVWGAVSSTVSSVLDAVGKAISTAWNTISSTTSNVWNAVKSVISGVWDGIKSAVSGAINAVSSTISNIWNSIKSTTSNIWNGILTAIQTPLNTAKSFVSGIIDAIKGFFNFKISWPKIPMPHFGINPSGWNIGDLLKGKIPSLAVDWYAQGGIMDTPTVFGMNGDKIAVGGEAGREAILPLTDAALGSIGRGIMAATPNMGQDGGAAINLTQNIYNNGPTTEREQQRQAALQLKQIMKQKGVLV